MLPEHADPWPCLSARQTGTQLIVQVVPNAGRTACAGLHGDALRVRLAAPAMEGRANAALLAWLADSLGLPKRSVTLLGGELARRKRVQIESSPEAVRVWLDQNCPTSDPAT